MMIPTIGRNYLYRLHHEKQQMQTEMERRRAFLVCCAITAVATIGLLVYLLR
jgi:hypothetical protein